jgi:cobalt transporter subunit CbtB
MIETRTISRPTAAAATSTALAAVVAMLLGSFLVYGVGFASPSTIHNAAHDGRHSFAFPCH